MNRGIFISLLVLGVGACKPKTPSVTPVQAGTKEAAVKADSVVERGAFRISHYHHEGIGPSRSGHSWWCEMTIHGIPYRPFAQDIYNCSLSPAKDPIAATLSIDKPADRGVYLLRLTGGKPMLHKLAADAWCFGQGYWTADGMTYLYTADTPQRWEGHGLDLEYHAIDVRTGEVRPLPRFEGHFLGFSPDAKMLASYTHEPPSTRITIHLTDLATGARDTLEVDRQTHGFLIDDSHLVEGTIESAHLWKAAQLRWERGPDGKYRLAR